MRMLLLGLLLGLILWPPAAGAYRMARPPEFSTWNTNTFTQLNDVLLQLWNISNGRYSVDVVTTTPKDNRKGNKGDLVLFDTGTDQLCVNVAGTITSWSCTNLTPL